MSARLHLDDPDPAYANVSASLSVLASIAASDAMCGFALKQIATGQDHREAVALLATVTPAGAKNLKSVLSAKSLSHYGSSFVTPKRAKELFAHAERLCREMDALLAT